MFKERRQLPDRRWRSRLPQCPDAALIDLGLRKRNAGGDESVIGTRLLEACEQERRRIARELHDDLSQRLGLLCIDVDQLAAGSGVPDTALASVQRIRALAHELASDLHHIAVEFHPERKLERGLLQALKELCAAVGQRSNLRVEFLEQQVPRRLTPALTLCIYRLVQEALRNIVRHSRAREALVELARNGENLELRIADPGVGFTMAALESTSIGLLSMHERVHQFGGRMIVHSAPGAGTRIGIRLPILLTPRESPLAAAG
jgi:two-component system NarL family sensor kinase